MKTFIYPGSFDPITNGHLDIIDRASRLCDRLVVIALINANKTHLFTLDERVDMIRRAVEGKANVEVDSYNGLLIDYLKKNNIKTIIKGIRTISDFDYEMQMALFYKSQSPDIETLFVVSDIKYSFVSSSLVKDLAKNGGNIDNFVPDCIKEDILKKFEKPGCS